MGESKRSGIYIALPDEVKQAIYQRCAESLRTPAQEVAWILRAWLRSCESDNVTEQEGSEPNE